MNKTETIAADQALDEFLGVKPEAPWKGWAKKAALVVAALVVLFVLYRVFAPAAKPSYATATAERGDLTVTVSATGNIRPINQVDVGSEQSGLITHVYVDVNDPVKKGQILAELDTARLKDAVTQAEGSLLSAQAGVAQADANLRQANLTLARYQEVAKLSDNRVPSKTEMDAAVAAQQVAAANLNAAKAQVASQQAALGSAKTNLSKARIYSPVDGVVLSRDIEPGQTVAATFNAPLLFTIAQDMRQMELQVAIDEADVGEVKKDQQATFTVDAFPGRTFDAEIKRVNLGSNDTASSSSSGSSAATSSGQVIAYNALLSVDNGDQLLRPGMTATADIVTTRLDNVLLVPNAAFRFRPLDGGGAAGPGQQSGGIASAILPRGRRRPAADRSATIDRGAQQTLYVEAQDGSIHAVTVTTGSSNGTLTEVLSGDLKPGDVVVTGQLAGGDKGAARGGAGARRNGARAGGGQQGGGQAGQGGQGGPGGQGRGQG